MTNVFDIVTCGSATVDAFAITQNEIRAIKDHGNMREFFVYPVGSKMIIEELNFHTGGGGTNTAVACAKLGLHTAYLGCMGTDTNAGAVLQDLRSYQISFIGHTSRNPTGYSVILDSIAHDRTILAYKGANDHFSFSASHIRNIKTRGLYCSSMMGSAYASQLKICAWAKKQKALVAYNPSSYQTVLGLRKMQPLLKRLDVLVFNKEEAQSMLGTRATGKELIHKLVKYVPTVIVTDGPHLIMCGHDKQYYEVFPPRVKVVETTGAGDAFASTVFASMLQGHPFEECLARGLANSQSVILKQGAKPGLLNKNQIESLIKKRSLRSYVKHGTII